MGFIYQIINDLNSKKYIGKCLCSIETRFKQHCANANRWANGKYPYHSHLYPAMIQDGIEHFFIQLLEECDSQILGEREKYYIQLYNTQDSTLGYNISAGGNSFWEGCHHTEETKRQISLHSAKPNLGKCLSTETKQKISNAKKGKQIRKPGEFHHSEETKLKLSEKKKGKQSHKPGEFHHDDETKLKLKKVNTGKKHSEETKQKQSTQVKVAKQKLSAEERSLISKKGWETRRKNKNK